MEVRVLGMHGGEVGSLRSSAFLLDGRVLLDAGGGVASLSEEDVLAVGACLLTHAHLDHVYGLPLFLDRRLDCPPLPVHAIGPVVDALQAHVFNDVMWPDVVHPRAPRDAAVRLVKVTPEEPFDVCGLVATAVSVPHAVPSVAWLVGRPGSGPVLFSGDTGPTRHAWEFARAAGVRAAFIEVSYPDAMADAAMQSMHLTPRTLVEALDLLPPGIPVRLIHLKPTNLDNLIEDLGPLLAARPNVEIARPGETYRFP